MASTAARPFRRAAPWLLALLGVGFLPAQDDLRDVITLRGGRELTGRVFSRYEPEGLVLLQGSRRTTIDKADVTAFDTVRDRVATFFTMRDRLPNNERHRWYVAEWAQSHGLPAMARLQALDVVLHDPEHEGAHRMLGHRRSGKRWLWPDSDENRTLAYLERERADWGSAWLLDSEHYTLHTNTNLRRAVDTLFDLERFHAWWYEQFGEAMRLYEVVGHRVLVHAWRDITSFSGLSSDKHPYFRHRIEGVSDPASSNTYFLDANAPRPERLFEVVTQHLLYRTLTDDPALRSGHRYCGFGEVGLARYVESCFGGPAGQASASGWRIEPGDGRLVVAERSTNLANMIHRSVRQFHFVVADDTAFYWAGAHLFVAYVLQDAQLRGGFFSYLGAALRDAKGDSSAEFDRRFGQTAEALEPKWRRWIAEQLAALPH